MESFSEKKGISLAEAEYTYSNNTNLSLFYNPAIALNGVIMWMVVRFPNPFKSFKRK